MSNDDLPTSVIGESGALVTGGDAPVGDVKPTVEQVKTVQAQKSAAAAAGEQWPERVQNYINMLKTSAAKNAFGEIAIYLKDMAPKRPVSPEYGAQKQVMLYRSIQTIINDTGEDFRVAFGTLLLVFEEYAKGSLGGRYVFRFMDNIPMGPNDREGYLRLVNMLIHLADGESRPFQLKTIDFARTLQYGVSPDGRARIQSFFGI